MPILACGTRLLLMARSSSAIGFDPTLGSPPRYDNSPALNLGGSVALQPRGSIGYQTVSYVHPVGLARAWFHWEAAVVGGVTGVFFDAVQLVSAAGNLIAAVYVNNGFSEFTTLNAAGSGFISRGSLSGISQGLTDYDLEFISGPNGGVNAYRGGSPWFSFSWTNGNATPIAGIRFANLSNNNNNTDLTCYSQFAMSDGDDLRGLKIGSYPLTGTGAYNDGAGTPAQTGDLDFSTGKTLSAANQMFTGTKASLSLPSGATLSGICVNATIRATAPAPNARVLVRQGGNDGFDANLSPAPTSGYAARSRFLAVNPVTGLPWTEADFNAAEFGWQARA